MEREGEAVMVAVLNSLVDEEPFHSSIISSSVAITFKRDTSGGGSVSVCG